MSAPALDLQPGDLRRTNLAAVVIDRHGRAWQKTTPGIWQGIGSSKRRRASHLHRESAPLRLAWTPEPMPEA